MEHKKEHKSGYLTGKLLVATPVIIGSCFARSVIFMCSHDAEGAMGIIVNLPMPNLSDRDIYEQLHIPFTAAARPLPIHFGGPVETARGFVLYSGQLDQDESIISVDDITLSSHIGILRDIATGKGPEHCILGLGYAGWAAGQLESEIENNSWFCVPATKQLIFETDNANKWAFAAQSIGVEDMLRYSPTAGHA